MTSERRYAENTKVSVSQSKSEITTLLRKHGATDVLLSWSDQVGDIVVFKLEDRFFRLEIVQPDPTDFRAKSNRARTRTREDLAEAEYRRRWRATILIVKAKLELVADGYTTVAAEFLANMMLADRSTVAERILPQIDEQYETGVSSPLLLGPGR